MTEEEQRAWEAEMKAAGIKVTTPSTSTVTLLKRPSGKSAETDREPA